MKKQLWLLIGLLVLLLVAAQCGGTPTPAATEEAPPATEEAAATEEAVAEPGLANEVYVFNWADYIDEELLTMYEEETGIKVVYDTFDSNESLLAKLQAGATGYDVIFPSDYMVAQMIELGLLAELDLESIPNFDYVADFNHNVKCKLPFARYRRGFRPRPSPQAPDANASFGGSGQVSDAQLAAVTGGRASRRADAPFPILRSPVLEFLQRLLTFAPFCISTNVPTLL